MHLSPLLELRHTVLLKIYHRNNMTKYIKQLKKFSNVAQNFKLELELCLKHIWSMQNVISMLELVLHFYCTRIV